MKKLLSAFCCALCIHTFGSSSELAMSSLRSSGEKQLLKALTAIVNRDDNKKKSTRRDDPIPADSPLI